MKYALLYFLGILNADKQTPHIHSFCKKPTLMETFKPGHLAELWQAQYQFSVELGTFEISGRSVDDPHKTLQALLDSFDSFLETEMRPINFTFKMTFFNTETTRIFLYIFEKLMRYQTQHTMEVNVHWYYLEDDEEMLQTGIEFGEVIGLNFHFIPIEVPCENPVASLESDTSE